MNIHLLVPMSGKGSRYIKAGYLDPKPMIKVSGIPMIQRLLEYFPRTWSTHFVEGTHHQDTNLGNFVRGLRPNSKLSFVPFDSTGPHAAILEGLKGIPGDDAVFISYCDYGMSWDPQLFEAFVDSSKCDAAVVCYRGFHPHYLGPTKYAYCRMDGERVVEVREKGSFTDNRENEYASAGGYYFRKASQVKAAIEFQLANDLKVNGEFYTSLTVEALIRQFPESNVRVFEIDKFYQWGTPKDLQNFEFWERSFKAYNRHVDHQLEVEQVLMPMAGVGSRFKEITGLPKPLIQVGGQPMFRRALDSLPKATHKTLLVTRREFDRDIRNHDTRCETLALDHVPEGQALTTLKGLEKLDPSLPVLISSTDHGIALSSDLWKEFRADPDCEAAIFTIKGFPGVDRRPEAFAYVAPETGDSHPFPQIVRVGVKKPLSASPASDHLLVGTFWFKSVESLKDGIAELERSNVRVNNELYLDSVVQIFLNQNKRVRIIPLDGYLCWGDPDSLAEALYWEECYMGKRLKMRSRFPGVGK